jgi:AbrB family looped-hinge helix DNA binding protein
MAPNKKVGTRRLRTETSKRTRAIVDRPATIEPSRVGERGTVVIPAALRRRYGIEEGTFVVAEPRDGGILIRPAVILPLEIYTAERKAQFLLSNTVDAADYARAAGEVQAMGLDPNSIPHYKPPGA